MQPSFDVVQVDGIAFDVRFGGFGEPLLARSASGAEVHLRPWTCREHLRLLGEHLHPDENGVSLDAEQFARDVLVCMDTPSHLVDEFAPLALWWAAGSNVREGSLGRDGWLTLGHGKVRLAPWTAGERLKALSNSVVNETDGAFSFNAGQYLGEMLRASVAETQPLDMDIWELNSGDTASLIAAVVGLNVPEHPPGTERLEEGLLGAQQVAANTLRLCRHLGWTPSQVLATPASEVDALLSMLDLVEAGRPAPASRQHSEFQGLAAYPDAIIIQVEDA